MHRKCPECENYCEVYKDPNNGHLYCKYCGYDYTCKKAQTEH